MDYIDHKTKRSLRKTTRNMNRKSKCIFQTRDTPSTYSRGHELHADSFLGTIYHSVIWYNVKKLMVISMPKKRINKSFSFLL